MADDADIILNTKSWKKASKFLTAFSKEECGDKIHQLRVEIKKIKALLNFFEFNEEKFKRKKIYEPIKNLYKKAGKIRDAQIRLALMKSYEGLHLSIDAKEEGKIIKKESKNLIKKRDKYLKLLKKSRKKAENFSSKIPLYNQTKYISSRLGIIEKNTIENFDEKNLHNLRKIVKELMYNIEIITLDPVDLQKFVDKKQLKAIQETIGNWHDIEMMICNLPSNLILNSLMDPKSPFLEIKNTKDFLFKKAEEQLISLLFPIQNTEELILEMQGNGKTPKSKKNAGLQPKLTTRKNRKVVPSKIA